MTPANGYGVPPGDGGREQDHNHSEGPRYAYAHHVCGHINSPTMRQRMLVDSGCVRVVQHLAQRAQ
jgi:hypothetical protein